MFPYWTNDSLFGIIIFVCLVSFIQYILTKDKSYLYYGGYVFANGWYFVEAKQELIFCFVTLPIGMEYKGGVLVNMLLISYICTYLFYEHFFHFKQKAPATYDVFRRYRNIQIWIVFIHTVVVYLILSDSASQALVSQLSLIPVILMSFIAYYYIWMIGTTLSRIVFAGTGFFLFGSVIGFIRSFDDQILPLFGHFLTTTKIGFVLELVFFSIALAYRSVILKGEKEQVIKEKELIQFQKGFYTNIAHEIRTPLTMILGLTNELKGEEDYKLKINIYGNQLLQLTDEAINRSQLESGNIQVRYTYDNILPFLHQLIGAATAAPITTEALPQDPIYMDYDPNIIRGIVDKIIQFASSNHLPIQDVQLSSVSDAVQVNFTITISHSSNIKSKWVSYAATQLLENYTKDANMTIDAIRDQGGFQICMTIHSDAYRN